MIALPNMLSMLVALPGCQGAQWPPISWYAISGINFPAGTAGQEHVARRDTVIPASPAVARPAQCPRGAAGSWPRSRPDFWYMPDHGDCLDVSSHSRHRNGCCVSSLAAHLNFPSVTTKVSAFPRTDGKIFSLRPEAMHKSHSAAVCAWAPLIASFNSKCALKAR